MGTHDVRKRERETQCETEREGGTEWESEGAQVSDMETKTRLQRPQTVK